MSVQTVETDIATTLLRAKTILDEARKTIDTMDTVASFLPVVGPFAHVIRQVTDALDDLVAVAATNAQSIAGIKGALPQVVIDSVPAVASIPVP
jgi:hypothetical protein